jgi:hypothetical protein
MPSTSIAFQDGSEPAKFAHWVRSPLLSKIVLCSLPLYCAATDNKEWEFQRYGR